MPETPEPTVSSTAPGAGAWKIAAPVLLVLVLLSVILIEVTPRAGGTSPIVSNQPDPPTTPGSGASRAQSSFQVFTGSELGARRVSGAAGGPEGLLLSPAATGLRLGDTPARDRAGGVWALVVATEATLPTTLGLLESGHPLGSVKAVPGTQRQLIALAAGPPPTLVQLTATPPIQLDGLALGPLGDRIELDLGRADSDFFAVSGLYPGEGEPQRRAAWSQGRLTRLMLPLEPRAGEYQLRFVARAHEAISPLTVTVALNGTSLGSFDIRETWTAPRLVVPANLLQRGLASLILEYSEVVQPSQAFAGVSTDSRSLALLLDRLWLEPRP